MKLAYLHSSVMTVKSFILSLVSLSFVCCEPGPLSEEEKKNISEEVKQTLEKYCSDIRESGLRGEFKYLDHSDDFFWTPPGYSLALNYDSIAAAISRKSHVLLSVDNRFDTLAVFALSKHYATYTGRLRSVVTDTTGKTSSYKMVETGLMIKREDGWKLLQGQTTMLSTEP